MNKWNDFTKIAKTRKEHRCAATGKLIPIGSSCWHYVGHWDGEFQNWYMSCEAKEYLDAHADVLNDWNGFECSAIGEAMREELIESNEQA